MITLYNVVSADEFIAREDGDEDFIPDTMWGMTLSLFMKYDCVMMGRGAYEALQSYDPALIESFEQKITQRIVVSKDKDFKVKEGYILIDAPEKIFDAYTNILVCSGPTLNNYLLKHNHVDRIIFHKLSTLIHRGMTAFDAEYRKNFYLISKNLLGGVTEEAYSCKESL